MRHVAISVVVERYLSRSEDRYSYLFILSASNESFMVKKEIYHNTPANKFYLAKSI